MLHDFVACGIFDGLVLFNELGAVHALVVQGEVDVDGGACLIDLRDAEGDPDAIFGEALGCSFVVESLFHSLAHIRDFCPRARQFERLAQGMVFHG